MGIVWMYQRFLAAALFGLPSSQRTKMRTIAPCVTTSRPSMIATRVAAIVLAVSAMTAEVAQAGTSTLPISDYSGVFIEAAGQEYQRLCSARLPGTAAQWALDFKRWQDANALSLKELRNIGEAIRRQSVANALADTGRPVDERGDELTLYTGFLSLAQSGPAFALAQANDQQAAAQCQLWRGLFAPGGALEQDLPEAIAGAKRLLQAERGAATR